MKRLIFPLFLLLIYSASSQDLSKFIYPDRFENSKTCLTKNNIATETVYNFNSLKKKSDSTVAMINRQILNNNIFSINETYVYNAISLVRVFTNHPCIFTNYPIRIVRHEPRVRVEKLPFPWFVSSRTTPCIFTNIRYESSDMNHG